MVAAINLTGSEKLFPLSSGIDTELMNSGRKSKEAVIGLS